MLKALVSFRPGSAGGPDGLRPCHLKTLTAPGSAEAGRRFLVSLTKFVNLVLEGGVPVFARPVFFGASLCALGKKDGGIRPIAVGNDLLRLATKVGAKPLARTEDLFRALIPEIEVVPESRATLLGAPLAEEGLSDAVLGKCEDLERLVSRLELIESHQAFVLYKNCFAIPKPQYVLRASPAYKQIDDQQL